MATPRSVWVTVDHLRDAVQAGLAPVREEVAELRRELRELDRKIGRLAQRPVRSWLSRRAEALLDRVGAVVVAALGGGALTFLLTHLL